MIARSGDRMRRTLHRRGAGHAHHPAGGALFEACIPKDNDLSESDSESAWLHHARANRRMMSLTLAIMTHVAAVVINASKSLARRRLRLSQARVRSTTQRRGSSTKPWPCRSA